MGDADPCPKGALTCLTISPRDRRNAPGLRSPLQSFRKNLLNARHSLSPTGFQLRYTITPSVLTRQQESIALFSAFTML